MKKKVSILTFQESQNFGALLQTYALAHVLKNLNCQVEVIDYRNEHREVAYKGIYDKNKSLKANINKILSFWLIKRRIRVADSFRKKYINLTSKTFYEKNELKKYTQNRDYIICGSDQIWNVINNKYDSTYFLDFVEEGRKKVAYAPSFGVEDISSNLDFYKKNMQNIQDFHHLSTREITGASIIRNLIGIDVPVVLDPCLLLSPNDWDDIQKSINLKERYIFVYCLKYSKKLVQYTKRVAKKTGCKVIISTMSIRDLKKGFVNVNMDVTQFVGCIKDAEYVITNSFHGTVFSILYHKKFIVFADESKSNNVNSRLDDLLNSLNLQDRFYDNERESLFDDWDYDQMVRLLCERRKQSIKYLTEALELDIG